MLDVALSSRAFTVILMHDMGRPPLYKAYLLPAIMFLCRCPFYYWSALLCLPEKDTCIYSPTVSGGPPGERPQASMEFEDLLVSHFLHHWQPTAQESQHIFAATADACMICALGCDADITASSAVMTSGNDAMVLPAHDVHRSNVLML